MKRLVHSALALAGLLVLGGGVVALGAATDEPDTPEQAAAAAYTLRVDLDLEKTRLTRALADYAAGETRRQEIRDQVSVLYARLGTLVRQGEQAGEDEDLESVEAELQAAEQAEEAVRSRLLRLRERIADSREHIRFLQEKLATLKRSVPPEPESLTGTWDVTYLPGGDQGVFTLRQSGTLISGEYTLEGGRKGSLQGTLIKNKVVLHRIDSEEGAVSDLEGFVSSDLRSIRGTWQSRILGDGNPSNGAWTGRKRESRRKEEPSR